MGDIGATLRFRIAKMMPFRYPRWPSWKSSNHVFSWTVSRIDPTYREALGWHEDLELLNSFHSKMVPMVGVLKRHLLSNAVGLSWNLVDSIEETWKFRTAKFVPFRYQSWPPLRPSLNYSNDISSQTIMRIEPKAWWEASERHRKSLLLKSFCYDIYDDRQCGGLSWNLVEGIGLYGDLELLKPFCYDIHDGRHMMAAIAAIL